MARDSAIGVGVHEILAAARELERGDIFGAYGELAAEQRDLPPPAPPPRFEIPPWPEKERAREAEQKTDA